MSLPDIDYELSNVGQFEYSVGLANASTPEDMKFVSDAFRAGQEKERERIWAEIEAGSSNGYFEMALFKLRKIINND